MYGWAPSLKIFVSYLLEKKDFCDIDINSSLLICKNISVLTGLLLFEFNWHVV